MAINFDSLFLKLGAGFYVIDQINEAVGTTIPPTVSDYLDQFDDAELVFKQAILGAESAAASFQGASGGAKSQIAGTLERVLIETVDADSPLPQRTLTEALKELIRQMDDDSQTVDASAVDVTPTASGGNGGDAVMVASAKRPDGRFAENVLAETIDCQATSATSVSCRGESAASDRLAYDWPLGSGASRSVTVTDAADSLLSGGGFDTETEQEDAPDDWEISVGAAGDTVSMTDFEIQTVTIAGDPTSGYYVLSWQNQAGKSQSTAPIAYNATGATVQAALRELAGLESVTVSTTGDSPNFEHAISFAGVPGNLSEITASNTFDTGSVTPATSSAGSTYAFVGKAVELDSDGAELTTLNHRVTLQPLTQYAFNLWAATDSVPAVGVLTVDLVDGIGGSVINDEQGTANSFTIDATALTTSFVAKNGTFRTPRVLPPIVYLRIRISTAVSNTSSVFLDHAALVEMTQLYQGGPYAAFFSGANPLWPGDDQNAPDEFSLTVTNDRAGAIQEWFARAFGMPDKGLLLPSDATGSETIDDSLIGSATSSSSGS